MKLLLTLIYIMAPLLSFSQGTFSQSTSNSLYFLEKSSHPLSGLKVQSDTYGPTEDYNESIEDVFVTIQNQSMIKRAYFGESNPTLTRLTNGETFPLIELNSITTTEGKTFSANEILNIFKMNRTSPLHGSQMRVGGDSGTEGGGGGGG